jgi:hypothetical protein
MKMKPAYVAAVALSLFAAPLATGAAAADAKIKLSGCVVKGEGDGAGYLLTNSPIQPSFQSSDAHAMPGAIGTTGAYANIFYWLDGNKDLGRNVGHQVEVEGYAKGDVKDGALKIDRKDNWTEMTVNSDGRTMTARVPNASVVPEKEPDHKASVLVRKVDVSNVKMIAASCQ